MKNNAYVVDLDGTLIKSNSFKYFFMLLASSFFLKPSKQSLQVSIKVISYLFLRKISFYSHGRFKQLLQYNWNMLCLAGCEDFLKKRFLRYFHKDLRLDLLDFLVSLKQEGDVFYLATAAPYEYASMVVDEVDLFDGLFSTPAINESLWYDNVREQKWHSIKKSVDGYDVISFTDHIDDAVLINNSQKAYLFAPIAQQINVEDYKNTKIVNFYEQ